MLLSFINVPLLEIGFETYIQDIKKCTQKSINRWSFSDKITPDKAMVMPFFPNVE